MSKQAKNTPSAKKGISRSTILWIVAAVIVVGIFALLMRPAASTTPGGASSTGKVVVVDTAKVQQLASQGIPIVDVRTPAEFAGGHIPGAQNIPIDVFPNLIQNWDKSKSLIVYCQSGSRSAQAVADLQQIGWQGTIYHLASGFSSWTGQVEQGASAGAAQAPAKLPATARPVMYEFYSDG